MQCTKINAIYHHFPRPFAPNHVMNFECIHPIAHGFCCLVNGISSRDSDAKGMCRLQEVSGNTEETTQGGGGASDSLVGTAGESGSLGGRRSRSRASGDRGYLRWDGRDGGVVERRGLTVSLLADASPNCVWKQHGVPGGAGHYGGDSRLEADSARAVGDRN